MGRSRLQWVVLGALVLALGLPAGASAADYSWDQPANFTTAGSGANPDHDPYGGTPWSYQEGAACPLLCVSPSHDPSTFANLPTFGPIGSTLSGWNDGQARFVGVDAAAPGTLKMSAASNQLTVLGWRNPLGHQANITVAGTIGASSAAPCFTWSLDQNGTPALTGSTAGSFNHAFTVPAGGSIYLTTVLTGSAVGGCEVADVTLHITAAEPTSPALALGNPGGAFAGRPQTLSGTASTNYGASPTVTVNVYPGNSTGRLIAASPQATRGPDGRFSVSLDLPNGTYTAQATQPIPGDPGRSSPVTFVVAIPSPASTIRLNSPGAAPLATATPTLTGTSDGDATAVGLAVYAGPSVTPTAIRALTGTRNPSTGTFSVTVKPALPDGQYTAIAAQEGSRPGLSNPVTFIIKTGPPRLAIGVPSPGGHLVGPSPTFTGTAGSSAGDATSITLALHSGNSAAGRSLGATHLPVSGGIWSYHWPRHLATGTYTLVAVQADTAGHTTTVATTFVIVPAAPVIGSRITLTGSRVSLPVSCTAPAISRCAGTVLVLTSTSLRPRPGGPAGPVRVLFAYVRIAGGHTQVVHATLPTYLARALRRIRHLRAKVTVSMTGTGRVSATRPIAT